MSIDQGTDDEQEKISEHVMIFLPNEGFCVCCPSNIFRNMHSYENWGNTLCIFPSFSWGSSWGLSRHVMHLDQLQGSQLFYGFYMYVVGFDG